MNVDFPESDKASFCFFYFSEAGTREKHFPEDLVRTQNSQITNKQTAIFFLPAETSRVTTLRTVVATASPSPLFTASLHKTLA